MLDSCRYRGLLPWLLCTASAVDWWESVLDEANAYEADDKISDAAKAYRRVLADETVPSQMRAKAASGVGYLAEREKHLDPAEGFYRQALKLNPAEVRASLRLGYLIEHGEADGSVDEARKLYRIAVAIEPSNAETHMHLALRLMVDEDEKRAVEYASQNRNAEAEKLLSLASSLEPNNAKPHTWLYMLLDQAGRHAEAEEHYQVANGIDPFVEDELKEYHDQKEL
mmetsp:Transcript_43369/g.68660  ORF Transcript_43369/g.68660 Transcript_43369/m.68660 type:complete len:226 (-) Transcript_43369:72-749(-)